MKLLLPILALSLAATAQSISAGQSVEPQLKQATVEYGDLDLSKPAGQATLDKRLAKAVRDVCDPGWTRSVRVATETRKCIADKHAELAQLRNSLIADAVARQSSSELALGNR